MDCYQNAHFVSLFAFQPSLSLRLWLPSPSNTPMTSSQWGVTSTVILDAAHVLGIRIKSAGKSASADESVTDSQLDCVVLKASPSTLDVGTSTAVLVDRNKRKDPEPDSIMKVRAVLMGYVSCYPREIAHEVAAVSSSTLESNSSSPDVIFKLKNSGVSAPSVQHPMPVVAIISALRDLLIEADEEDWFGSSQLFDAHS